MAITTCNNADINCPFIPTASHRFHLPFVDPKHSDGSDTQEETYLQTSQQIAGEIYFIFSEVKKLV
jgi:arsenate reductase